MNRKRVVRVTDGGYITCLWYFQPDVNKYVHMQTNHTKFKVDIPIKKTVKNSSKLYKKKNDKKVHLQRLRPPATRDVKATYFMPSKGSSPQPTKISQLKNAGLGLLLAAVLALKILVAYFCR